MNWPTSGFRELGYAGDMGRHLAKRGFRYVRGVVVGRAQGGGGPIRNILDGGLATRLRPASEARRQRSVCTATVYQRGAMTLGALRFEIGDDTFFSVLKEYVSRYGGGNVSTSDFICGRGGNCRQRP